MLHIQLTDLNTGKQISCEVDAENVSEFMALLRMITIKTQGRDDGLKHFEKFNDILMSSIAIDTTKIIDIKALPERTNE